MDADTIQQIRDSFSTTEEDHFQSLSEDMTPEDAACEVVWRRMEAAERA